VTLSHLLTFTQIKVSANFAKSYPPLLLNKTLKMNKLSLKSRSEITYLPNKELRIIYRKSVGVVLQHYFHSAFFIFPIVATILVVLEVWQSPLFIFIIPAFVVLWSIVAILPPIFFVFNPVKEIIIGSARFIKIIDFYKSKDESAGNMEYFDSVAEIDFEVKLKRNSAILTVKGCEIPIDNIKNIPLIIDNIAELWRFRYLESKTLANGTEVLAYKKKWQKKS
jgi:hypothetical protein